MKFLALTLTGFLLFGGAIVSGYFYLNELGMEHNPWYLLISIIACISLSAVCMLLASRIKSPFLSNGDETTTFENDPSIATTGLKNTIEKQNEIIAQWRKTNHMKDKMTMIKITSNAQKQSNTP